jgi:steroid delta-isomerase-like uncharacterized protein
VTDNNKETNKAVVRRYIDEVNRMNLDALDELVAFNYVDHNALPGMPPGRESLKQAYRLFSQAFPDVYFTLEDLVAEGDRVAARGTVRGTHRGDFFGLPATGKQATWTGIHIFRIADDKAVEGWLELDQLSLMQQLGAIPAAHAADGHDASLTPVDQNKALFRRLIDELWNGGRLEAADELFADDAYSPSMPGLPRGPEGVKQVVSMFRAAFPDLTIAIDDLVGEGDTVVGRLTERATHKGEFMGVAPTGKPITLTEIAINRYLNGKIVESSFELDMYGLLQQLGALPSAGSAPAA